MSALSWCKPLAAGCVQPIKEISMKNIEDMTIQEMVAKLDRVERKIESYRLFCLVNGREPTGEVDGQSIGDLCVLSERITRALDKKCLEAGISIEGERGMLVLDYFRCYASGQKLIEAHTPAADIHALLGYLLGKEE